jgi:hypothetical protein
MGFRYSLRGHVGGRVSRVLEVPCRAEPRQASGIWGRFGTRAGIVRRVTSLVAGVTGAF